MTELARYLGVQVHVDVSPHGICGDGVLSIEDGFLRFSGDPLWRFPLAHLRARETPFGPVELPHQADVVLLGDFDVAIYVWLDRERQPWCDPAWWPTGHAHAA